MPRNDMVSFWICPACYVPIHRDDANDIIEHKLAHRHAPNPIYKTETAWWELGDPWTPSGSSTADTTPVHPSQFEDAALTTQRIENRESERRMRLHPELNVNPKAWARNEKAQTSAESGRFVKPPGKGASPQKELTNPPASVRVKRASAFGSTKSDNKVQSRKEHNNMPRKKQDSTDPYAAAKVNSAPVDGAITPGATVIVMTAGRNYNDTEAIDDIMGLIAKAHGKSTVIINQGRWAPDQLIADRARKAGLSYQMRLPLFLREKRASGSTERVSDEDYATKGYSQLAAEMAAQAAELHVFGEAAGPQRGIIDAFNAETKPVRLWTTSK